MRFLITGATGMIGQKLVKKCHDLGIAVNYLTTSKTKLEKKDNYTGFYWDPSNKKIDTSCFKDVDVIINLVGANVAERWTAKYKRQILESRTASAALLVDSLKDVKHNISQIVSASAIGIYESSLTKLHTEDEDEKYLNNQFIGQVVSEWESAVDQFKELGLNVAKLRIGIVLSKKGGALEKMAQPIKYYAGAPLGSGEQWQSWIHIDDLVELFIYAAKYQITGVYNAVAPNPVTNTELTKSIAKQINKPLILPNVPSFVLKLMLGEMSTIVLSSQLVSSKKIVSKGFQFEYSYLKNALKDLL